MPTGITEPIVCGRKFCTTCNRWRFVMEFSCHEREPLKLYARCKTCTRIYRRARDNATREQVNTKHREHYYRHLEKRRAYNRENKRKMARDPVKAAAMRAQRMAWQRKMRADPARWTRELENQRIAYRLRAEREGRKVREIRTEIYANGNGAAPIKAHLLPAQPIVDLISEWTGEFGGITLGGHDWRGNAVAGAGLQQLAELSGIPDRSLRAYVNGHRKRIQYATADKICTALDTPISSLYPEL